jgi:pimeloyl-ACP methyl ester carboxylesterase
MSLHVHESGSPNAPTIVFLHALGLSSWMWNEQITALQANYHCLAIDLPANGESYQTEWRSFADTAAQIAPIIREKAVAGKAHVVGLSLGGFAALHLLRDHADVVDSMVISGVATKPSPTRLYGAFLAKPSCRCCC